MDDRDLLEQAKNAALASYAPYSEVKVGAAVVAADGQTFAGSNVENAAYGSSVCAETAAIGAAVTAGCRGIETVAVASLRGEPCPPCGNCRQIMNEFGVRTVVLEGESGEPVAYALGDLLPRAFGPEQLSERRRSS